jgi:hypothetical protein
MAHLARGTHARRVISTRRLASLSSWCCGLSRTSSAPVDDPERQRTRLPYERLSGFRATGSGTAHRSEAVVRSEDPRGRPFTGSGRPARAQMPVKAPTSMRWRTATCPVTPLQVDLTRHHALERRRDWLNGDPPEHADMGDAKLTGIGMTSARTRER